MKFIVTFKKIAADLSQSLLRTASSRDNITLMRAASFFAQLAICSTDDMFTYTTLEIAAAAILCACDLSPDIAAADAVLKAVPGARPHECANRLRAACVALGLTLAGPVGVAPDGPPLPATVSPRARVVGPAADGAADSEI